MVFTCKGSWRFLMVMVSTLILGVGGLAHAQLFPDEKNERQRVLDLLDNISPPKPTPEGEAAPTTPAADPHKPAAKKHKPVSGPVDSAKEKMRIPIYAHNPVLGPLKAPVTVIEFSDIGCTTCLSLYKPLKAIVDKYPQHIAWVHKHAALNPFGASNLAAFYGQIAQRHTVFWEFRNHVEGVKAQTDSFLLKALAKAGLSVHNSRQLVRLYARDAYRELDADTAQNNKIRLQAPPVIMVNGYLLTVPEGEAPAKALENLVKEHLVKEGVLPPENKPAAAPDTQHAAPKDKQTH